MRHDVVYEGHAFIKGSFQQCCIGVDEGKITSIKKILTGDEIYRFPKKIIFPTGIDIHVHFRDPGMIHKEDFQTGSTAAVCGGISCVFDMPNTIPLTTSITALDEKLSNASKISLTDFGLHAGISDGNIDQIVPLSKSADGFKIYLGSTTNALILSTSHIGLALKEVEKTGRPVLFHAEDPSCLKKHKIWEKNLKDHHRARPFLCETTAVENVLKHVIDHEVSVHLCHISSPGSIELLKNKPDNVTFGLTPHHSLLDIDHLNGSDTRYKVNPPLRPAREMDILFESICNGPADILESDHAPHILEEKKRDFDEAPSGIPGVETMMPLFFYLAVKEKLSFSRLFNILCDKPASLMNISKGSLEVGNDGDIAVFDARNISKISADRLHSKADWSPFEGYPAIFPSDVFIRGEHIVDEYECIGKPGFGKHVKKKVDND